MASKRRHALGRGEICPRCNGRKPGGMAGAGICLSRRGRAFICSKCGLDEALIDQGMAQPDIRETRLLKALAKAAGGSA